MARTATGVDIGARTNKFLRGTYRGNTFHVSGYGLVEHKARDLAEAWEASELDFKPQNARIGLTGRDVNIRYTRVPRVPDWQLRKLMRFEVEEIGGQSGSEVASDFNVLPPIAEIEGEDVVLLAMARESLLETHGDGLASIGGTLDAYAPNALALYNAWLRYGVIEDDTILLACIGRDNLDVILVRGPDLLFARNLSGGSKLFDDAIAERMGVSADKAESLKREMANLEPGARYRDANHEKVSRACLGAAGGLLSLLQSTVMFCKSQVKLSTLRIDRVLLCGGGARLEGLAKYLSNGLSVPVELFDPFRVVDTTALAPDDAAMLEAHRLESVVALGLATMGADPDAYSVEILPAKVRARREFVGGTVYTIAAGVLALAYLGYHGWDTKTRLDATRTQSAALDARLKRATSVDRQTSELMAKNKALAEEASALQGIAGSGEQLARVLFAAQETLPGDFWISSLTSDWRFNDALRVERGSERPIVHIEGRAREGTQSINAEFQTFLERFRERLARADMNQTLSPSGEKFTLDVTLLAPPAAPAEASETASGDSAAKDPKDESMASAPAGRGAGPKGR
jgi:type IV pilus assembly protein PilM